ncbi:MAG TPA: hypothetical protein VMT92_03100 [Steroidobacteraceae bacterium]|nr:hypothetical protein [Steroidobacteraceae bacterium]
MSAQTFRPVELLVASVAAATVLLIAIAPALLAAPPATAVGDFARLNAPGLEWVQTAKRTA